MKESIEHTRAWSAEQTTRIDAIPRKPLPSLSSTQVSTSEHLRVPSTGYSQFPAPATESEEDIQPGSHVLSAKYISSSDASTTVMRKPMGPRSFNSSLIERKPVRGSRADENARQTAGTRFPPQIQSLDVPEGGRVEKSADDVERSWSQSSIPPTRHCQLPPPPPLRPSYFSPEHGVGKDFCVTMIRRDPTSGSQWNIGSLSREQQLASMEGDLLKIEITTPGYQKFARQSDHQAQNQQAYEQAVGEHEVGSTLGNLVTTSKMCGTTPKASRPSSTYFEQMPFKRDITLNRPTPSQWSKSSQHHHRSSSSDSFPVSSSKPTSLTSPKAQAQLTFSSPWHGTCTFTTGMDGRSLKCRHQLSSSTIEQSDNSVLVAELRFNLPWSALRSRDANASAPAEVGKRPKSLALLGEDAKHSFKKGMARIRQEINSNSSETETRTGRLSTALQTTSISPSFAPDDDSDSSTSSSRLDLKLGREQAGGGRRGKSAKLGKLVLRDEGLKMADLVVAACVGVWWDVYWGKKDASHV